MPFAPSSVLAPHKSELLLIGKETVLSTRTVVLEMVRSFTKRIQLSFTNRILFDHRGRRHLHHRRRCSPPPPPPPPDRHYPAGIAGNVTRSKGHRY